MKPLFSLIFSCFVFYCLNITATIHILPTPTSTETFSSNVNTQVFDRATGTFFVGRNGGGIGADVIGKALRPSNITVMPKFIPIGNAFTDQTILKLALSTFPGNISPNLALLSASDQSIVSIIDQNGNNADSSDSLNDANNAITDEIINISASAMFIFAALKPHGTSFGMPNSGIAVVEIGNNLTLTPQDAQTGAAGNRAQFFDNTVANTPSINITSDTIIEPDIIAMHWDPYLERLFLGVQIATGVNANDGAESVAVARVDNTGALTIVSSIDQGALVNNDITKMIAVQTNGGSLSLAALQIDTMHTSPGATYLIVNGGNGIAEQTNNTIYALPLVDNPENAFTHGTVARKDSVLIDGKFVVPATANIHLPTNTEEPVLVGTGPLPIEPTTPISAMHVIGDAVYVSIAIEPDNNNDSGIFYSQAQFDHTGKIVRWTPWTKRAFPFTGVPEMQKGQVTCFALDAVTGKIWAIDSTMQNAYITAWTMTAEPESLVSRLNKHLSTGCYAILDLDQATHSFINNTEHRFALFGGLGRVVFTRTSQAINSASVTSPQLVTTNFTLAKNLLVTTLPVPNARVRSLEYSRRNQASENYFFAGTDLGLFVFADIGNIGFGPTLPDLENGIFVTGSWQKINAISGSIIDVKSIGNALYVLTFENNSSGLFDSKLYLIPFATTLATMFADSNIHVIAQTKTAPTFDKTIWFLAIDLIADNTTGTQEQIILATNAGLYNTTRAGGIQHATSTQTNAGWTRISDSVLFLGISNISNTAQGTGNGASAPTTLWPFSLSTDGPCFTSDRSDIYQLGTTGTLSNFVPENFNSINADTNTAFQSLPFIYTFWSDGGRRFFIVKQKNISRNQNILYSLPFHVIEWNITSSAHYTILDSPLIDIAFFNTMELIGATGIFIVGTNKGVIALQ